MIKSIMSASGSALALALLLAATGCEQERGAERMGERMDKAIEDTGHTMRDAAEKAGDRMEKATD